MEIFLMKKSYFTFGGQESYALDILGKTPLELMAERLGTELKEEFPPEECDGREIVVLFPVYPFITIRALRDFCASRSGSFAFEGGYVLRGSIKRKDIASLPVIPVGNAFGAGLFRLEDLPSVLVRAARESARIHLSRGVLIEDGAEVGFRVEIGAGTHVGRGVRLSGETKIGQNVRLFGNCQIEDSEIGDRTSVNSSVLLEARVGADCTVGPFAYLRPFSEISDGCRIGDFVEIKNANVGKGCKISHLAYVGDADLGERVNVGCGAIFVNYDGLRKCRSRVGNDCFIGSNCNVIAPVDVADGAYIAAGTTLTRDLECGDFCIGRSRETVKKGRNFLSSRD